jgi:hypothetical protein
MGARLIFGATIGVLHLPTPASPFAYTVAERRTNGQLLPEETLRALRVVAVAATAIGLALLAWRCGPQAASGLVLFLVIPQIRDDLTRAWAEGPLMLSFGLCALATRSRTSGITCGLAAATKLTGLVTWPILLFSVTSGRTRGARLGQLGAAIATWTLLTPPAWFAGGPLFLGTMILHRLDEHAAQARIFGAGWLWVPTHYVLPLELVACLLFGLGVSRVAWMLERSTWLAATGKTRASTSLRRHD